MAKLTKKQSGQLQNILYDIERAYNFIEQPEVKGLAHEIKEDRTNGGDYKIINSACVETSSNTVEFIRLTNKNYGSDIAGLHMGLRKLKNFIEFNEQ